MGDVHLGPSRVFSPVSRLKAQFNRLPLSLNYSLLNQLSSPPTPSLLSPRQALHLGNWCNWTANCPSAAAKVPIVSVVMHFKITWRQVKATCQVYSITLAILQCSLTLLNKSWTLMSGREGAHWKGFLLCEVQGPQLPWVVLQMVRR